MKSLYEELGGTYRQVGDYFIPNIELPERNYEIGKYGRISDYFVFSFRMEPDTFFVVHWSALTAFPLN